MPDPSVIAWHPTLTGDIAGAVPDLMAGTNALVSGILTQNQTYATSALAAANAAIVSLSNARLPPSLPDPPDAPSIITSAGLGSSTITPVAPFLGSLTVHDIPAFVQDNVVITDISAQMPVYVPVVTGLTIPEAPIFTMPASPASPALSFVFDAPSAPAADYGLPPSLFELNLPTYAGITLPVFNDAAPEFSTLPPSPFIQWVEPVYSSGVKTAIASVLATMLAGGTGLPADVERAIWERAREREVVGTNKAIDEATTLWTTRGFTHPPGQLNNQILIAREEGARKSNDLSRDQAIKQADLEQTNRNFAVDKGISYEQVFVGLFGQIVDRNFQIAKFSVETQIQIYNMQVTAFNVNQSVFAQKGERYRLLLEAAFADLKVFEARVNAEKLKGDFNAQLNAQFDSKIKAFAAVVAAYDSTVKAAIGRSDLEKNKVELFKAQIEGQVAQVNVQRGAFEAYSARVAGESAKAGLEESNARVFGSKVQAFATKSEIGLKIAETELQKNRQSLEYDVANMQRVTAGQEQQLRLIQANLAGYQAATSRVVAQQGANQAITQLQITTQQELSRLAIAKYQALLGQWTTRAQEIIEFGRITAESLRAAGTIASNLASGAMAGTHVSAGVSAAANSSQQRSDQKSEHLGFNQNMNDSSSYNININRKGADVA